MSARPAGNIRIEDIMRLPASVTPDTPVREVLALLRESGAPGVPVVDVEERPIGFITDGDMLAAAMPGYLTLMEDVSFVSESSDSWVHYFTRTADRPVSEVMNREVACVELGVSELEVVHKMVHDGVSSVVITREGKVVGIVNRLDLYVAICEAGR